MKTRLHRFAATVLIAVLMAGALPVSLGASQPDSVCTVCPWWPGCHRGWR